MPWLKAERQKEIDLIVENIFLETGTSYPDDSLLDIIRTTAPDMGIEEAMFGTESGGLIRGAIYYEGKPKIVINRLRSSEGKLFTLAHEFGHYILHKGQDSYRLDFVDYSSNDAVQETEANYFAASLLMPANRLKKVIAITHGDINKIAKYFRVSEVAVEKRLQWLERN